MKKGDIEIKGLGKTFLKSKARYRRFVISGRDDKEETKALDGINLKIKKGENVGIIGYNGAGKSTLIKIIAGLYDKSEGDLDVVGRAFYLTGFKRFLGPKLSVRDNISLISSFLGMGQRDIFDSMSKVVKTSELEGDLNTRVYQLSNGMGQRVSFSIILNALEKSNPDVVLFDDIFSVRVDFGFKFKIADSVERWFKSDKTVIISSHELDFVRDKCDRVIWLDKGKIKMIGRPKKVIDAYLKSMG
tara:strand:+ start:410 stop:1144 length:735 start_codon:yes stop_codon:yes gene_type:complete